VGIGDKLRDNSYKPDGENFNPDNFYFNKTKRCPVSFTADPIEYIEGYLQYNLRPFQREVIQDIFSVDAEGIPRFDVATLIIGMRCLGLGTEVLMYDGTLKKIEDIGIGELVMGPDSKSRKVLNVSRGKSELYEIQQSHAMTYIVNENHILSLKRTKLVSSILNISIKEYLKKPEKWRKHYKGYKAKFCNKRVLSSLKVKSMGIGEYAGIEVNNDNLFCLSDYTVTHNSGKSFINSVIASFLLHRLLSMDDPAKELGQVPHYKLSGSFVANSEQQSRQTAYSSFENILSSSPWWKRYILWLKEREDTEGRETLFIQTQRRIYFPEKNLEILSLHSNSQSIAGLTAFFVSFEEISRADIVTGAIQDQSEKRTAQAVYYTASRATKSLYPFSKIVVTTSPMYENDFGMQLLYVSKEFKCGINKSIMDSLRIKYPNKADRMIAYNFTSFEANPRTSENPSGFTDQSFQMEKISNPTAAMRDFWAIPPNALSPFFEYPEKIESCINPNQEVLVLFEDVYFEETFNTQDKFEVRKYIGKRIFPQVANKIKRYVICCDQGEVKDSFVVAMGHGEDVVIDSINSAGVLERTKRYKIIIDLVEEWKPNKADRITVSFQNVEEAIRVLGQQFYVTRVLFDQWNSVESIQRLFSEGLYTERIGATMEMYETLKLLIYSGMVELPENQKLISELRQLNRIRTGSGREKTEHPSSGGKDLADAVVRVVWSVYNDSISQGMKDNFILPIVQKFSTVRSAGIYFKSLQDSEMSGYDSTIFGTASPGSDDIFGKDFIVRGNVIPNVGR